MWISESGSAWKPRFLVAFAARVSPLRLRLTQFQILHNSTHLSTSKKKSFGFEWSSGIFPQHIDDPNSEERSRRPLSLVIRENNSFLKRPRKRASEFHAQFCRPTDLRSIRSLLQRKFQRRNDESGWERWGNVVKPWKHSAGCRRHDWVLPKLNRSF